MLTGLLFALTLAPGTAGALVPPGTTQEPAVKVWLNKGDRVDRGDRVKAYVRTDDDGYLLVLHVEPDGRIRFLYPIDPYVDNFVRGHDKVEIRGRGGREAFRVYQEDGLGTVFAAFFRDPFEPKDFVVADHWDYRALEAWRLDADRDPEAELTALVQQIAGAVFFEYDLIHYSVGETVAYRGRSHVAFSAGLHFGGYPYYYGPGFSFGVSFGPVYASHGWGHRYYHLRFCDPFLYDPWICHSSYYAGWPYYYGSYYYGSSFYRPYYYATPYYYPYSRSPYGRGYYAYGNPNRASGHIGLGRYAFKPDQNTSLSRGVGVRRRSSSFAAATRRRTSESVTTVATRRATGARTVSTPRRLAPVDRLSGQQEVGSSRRTVRPNGWGITDGRRTVRTTTRPTRVRRPSDGSDAGSQVRRPSDARPTGRTEVDARIRRPAAGNTEIRRSGDRPQRPEASAVRRTPRRVTGNRATVNRPQARRSTVSRRIQAGSGNVRRSPARAPSRVTRGVSTPRRAPATVRIGRGSVRSPSRPSVSSRRSPSRATPARRTSRPRPRRKN